MLCCSLSYALYMLLSMFHVVLLSYFIPIKGHHTPLLLYLLPNRNFYNTR
eukprot:m.161619 g.161619  ORF g.161619 m.161619 type:complete len:50 (-) comp16378_c1_seq2:1383-1532(-)